MVIVEWGRERREEVAGWPALEELLDEVASAARADGKPQDVQVTVSGAGTLGIVVGADWSVLNHVPPDLEPPYAVSVGSDRREEPVTFYVAGDHHSEASRRHTIGVEAARNALRHFVATGELSPEVVWEPA